MQKRIREQKRSTRHGPTKPRVEITFDQDTILNKNSLAQEIAARHVALLLVEKDIHPLLTPLRKPERFTPKSPNIINLCGPPDQGGFNNLQCALAAEKAKKKLSGASSTCLLLASATPFQWLPKHLQPSLEEPYQKKLLDNALKTPPKKPSYYEKTFGGELFQCAFLEGEPQTFSQNGGWKLFKCLQTPLQKALKDCLRVLTNTSRCEKKRLYGLLQLLQPAEHPKNKEDQHSPIKILRIELNTSLHPESPYIQSLHPLKISYKKILERSLNL